MQVPLRRARELKTILRGIVSSGEYVQLQRSMLVAVEAFKYYLDKPTQGATPLVVAEMMAVTEAPSPPKLPFPAPYQWQQPLCHFLEKCPYGCDNAVYPPGKGRYGVLVDHYPCDPVMFAACKRVPSDEVSALMFKNPSLVVVSRVWGEPDGAGNETLCPRASDYVKKKHK